jgi:hypothetical protein
MAIGEIHVGQILPLIFIVKDQDGNLLNLTSATSKTITIVKPNDTKLTVDAVFVTNGVDGQMQYVTKNETNQIDLEQVGNYKAQGRVIVGGIEYPSDIVPFTVTENL